MGPWPACGHANNKCTACPSYQAAITVKKPTPAPEREVWDHAFRPKTIVEWPWSLASSLPPDYAKRVLSDDRYEVVPLYASPVVPVGVSREEIAKLAEKIITRRVIQQRLDGYTIEAGVEIADAILAALRPTDTGRE
jgi:hypothetical protein